MRTGHRTKLNMGIHMYDGVREQMYDRVEGA